MLDLKKTLKITQKITIQAGKFLEENQSKTRIVIDKGHNDFATDSDLSAEKIIIDKLNYYFPDHNIYSEEKGNLGRLSPYRWVIDPLDGTRGYFRQIPHYAVILALEYLNKLKLGVAYFPVSKRLYSGLFDYGAFLNQTKLKVSANADLHRACIYAHLPDSHASLPFFQKTWKQIAAVVLVVDRLRGKEHDIENLCLVAQGAIDACFVIPEPQLWGPKWWDVAAGILMVQEAGGKVTDVMGKPIKTGDLSRGLIASNGVIHEKLLKILNS